MESDAAIVVNGSFFGEVTAPALTTGVEEACVGAELAAATRRRRLDRLEKDRERTEELLRAVDGALQRGFREMERRAEEQRSVELAIRWMVGMKRFSRLPWATSSVSRSQSLREKERLSKAVTTDDQEEAAPRRKNAISQQATSTWTLSLRDQMI